MIASPRALARKGILSINKRNTLYVADGNPRRRMPMVNDKVKTKELARKAGVPVPELYGVIEMQAQIRRLRDMLGARRSFVIKPACGAQGDGIMVVAGENRKGWRLASGKVLNDRALRHHISNVLSGMYSLNGLQDVAMLEETVRFADMFGSIAEAGVPDLRIIVYRGVPTMAMARIPTRESDGKANLHKGGIGIGIDIATGVTKLGVQYDRIIADHPETGAALSGIKIPEWRSILDMSARCYAPTGLDYLGVDIVCDDTKGPLLLELNARPGLAVQLANHDGLERRLRMVAEHVRPDHTQKDRVELALRIFSSRA